MSLEAIGMSDRMISPAALELLKTALAPNVLGKDSDRFDVGVEFQKHCIREQINSIVNRQVL